MTSLKHHSLTPTFAILDATTTIESEDALKQWIGQQKLSFPVVVKSDNPRFHNVAVIARSSDWSILRSCQSCFSGKVILQQFVPHGGFVLKVYVCI